MGTRLLLSAIGFVAILSIGAIAQTQQQDHQEHHPGGATAPTVPPASPPSTQVPPAPPAQRQMPMGQMMQGMPEQCRAMMQNMPADCMSMMQQMMRGRMGGAMPGMQAPPASQSGAAKAYMDAAERMHGPMMEGLRASDPDVAFVRGMIAHHQGAVDMAKIVLQYGKDDQTKKWANDIIREQEREIAEMQEWLKKSAH
jgi:uncharacterized protein (DUF305 family)